MSEVVKTKNSRNMHVIILGIIGIIALVAGIAVITVRGNPFRGSGLGTILSVLGVAVLVIAFLRFAYKRS